MFSKEQYSSNSLGVIYGLTFQINFVVADFPAIILKPQIDFVIYNNKNRRLNIAAREISS